MTLPEKSVLLGLCILESAGSCASEEGETVALFGYLATDIHSFFYKQPVYKQPVYWTAKLLSNFLSTSNHSKKIECGKPPG